MVIAVGARHALRPPRRARRVEEEGEVALGDGEGAWGRGGAYIVASVVLCLLAVWIGYALAAAINRAST